VGPARLGFLAAPQAMCSNENMYSSPSNEQFSRSGVSYAQSFINDPGRAGSPGQDLRRIQGGPSLYLNGTPDSAKYGYQMTSVGAKSTLHSTVRSMPFGRFQNGQNNAPGMSTTHATRRKLACSKSYLGGSDPYCVRTGNIWRPENRLLVFPPKEFKSAGGRTWTAPPSSCSRGLLVDSYNLAHRLPSRHVRA